MLSWSRRPPSSLWVACMAMLPGPSRTTTTAYVVARPGRASRPAGSPACHPTASPATTKPRLLRELAGCRISPDRAASQKPSPRPTSGPSHAQRAARYIRSSETTAVPVAAAKGPQARDVRSSATIALDAPTCSTVGLRLLPALGGRHEVEGPVARVDLLGPGDLLVLVLDQLEPLGQPSRRPADGEQHREHLRRELEGLV